MVAHELLLLLSGNDSDNGFFYSDFSSEQAEQGNPDEESDFNAERDSSRKKIPEVSIREDFSHLLHSSEREALCSIAKLGLLYKKIKLLIEPALLPIHSNLLAMESDISGEGKGQSELSTKVEKADHSIFRNIYFIAICSEVNEILSEYQQLLVEIEMKLLSSFDLNSNGGRVPISFFHNTVAKVILSIATY
jgi:hypothetical protein